MGHANIYHKSNRGELQVDFVDIKVLKINILNM